MAGFRRGLWASGGMISEKNMTDQINCADIVRLRRYDAVCVAVSRHACTMCFLVPDSENTRHRADISLSMIEAAQAGLAPDQRVRCVGRPQPGLRLAGAVVGRMPPQAMRRIQAMLARENALAAAEQVAGPWRGPVPVARMQGHAYCPPVGLDRPGTVARGRNGVGVGQVGHGRENGRA